MFSRTAETVAVFSTGGRLRSEAAVIAARLLRSMARFSSPCSPMVARRPLTVSAFTFRLRCLAPMVPRMTLTARCGRCPLRILAEILLAVVDEQVRTEFDAALQLLPAARGDRDLRFDGLRRLDRHGAGPPAGTATFSV
jgi:hypothetical protein